MFEFKENLEDLDYRSHFANDMFKLLLDKYNHNLKATIESEEFLQTYLHIKQVIRNIYELVDTEVPLIAYYEIVKLQESNEPYNKEKIEETLIKVENACKLYYGN